MYEATLLKMYLVDKNSNLASSKVVSNISKIIKTYKCEKREQKMQSVSLNTKYYERYMKDNE